MILLPDLLSATGGRRLEPLPGEAIAGDRFAGFCFDSRRARQGELFVALKTDRGDGHDFIADALARGCTGALIQDDRHAVPGRSFIVVPDTLAALADYARATVRRRGLPVVAITGSLGKTSVREAVAAVLSCRYSVFRNPANFNGRLGLSIALGDLEPHHQVLVLEMGTDAPGEIRDLCDIAPPQVGLITNISESHLAFFGSMEEIAREKATLIEAVPPGGLAILNADEPRVWALRERARAPVTGVHAADEAPGAPEGIAHPAFLISRAFARRVGRYFGVPDADIDAALSRLEGLPGRMNRLAGVNGCVLIDDTFNANPTSLRAAIEAVARPAAAPATALYLILGDMDQLGDDSARLHHEAGRRVAQAAAAADRPVTLVTLGEQARHIADGALSAGLASAQVVTTYLSRDAVEYVRQRVLPGDLVLVKGDTSARMERVTAALLADPGAASRLARQEPGWEKVRIARPARPTWLDVDLDAIAHNTRAIRQLIGPGVALMAVLKADGYGHGAVKVARTALNNGAAWCGVASLNEAVALRAANIEEPILILGYTPAWHARDALLRDVAVTLYDLDIAQAFSRAAQELRRTARAHVKIDTGMGRLGLLPGQAPAFIRAIAELPRLEVEGVFTHFSCADSDPDYTLLQLDRFRQATAGLPITPRYLHAANSAAALTLPDTRLNMVRVGLALYGLSPFAAPLDGAWALRPALAWKTTIAQVKTLPDGAPVSYGATYRCAGERRIAVIAVGYADGFRRAPQHFGEVLVRGQRAPIVGRVCMDQTMLDVTHIPAARIGDEVVLIGRQGDAAITAEDVAARLGTINYEVVSAILPRVPRVS